MIAIGSDHGGFALKEQVRAWLEEKGIPCRDFGCYDEHSVDYPDIAASVGRAVASGECEKGFLFCGTGLGISMAANKIRGVRAACCSDCFSAKMSRAHNDANILCMGGRVVGPGLALMMAELFLTTEFEGGRHSRRVEKLMALERE